eukprot:gene29325-38405_t
MFYLSGADLLRKGKLVVSTGVAGIGKSTEMNTYLMEFLGNIGKEGLPKEVWYRIEESLLKFSLSSNGEAMTEEQDGLAEDEVNPHSYIPTLVQIVEGITKEFQKSGATYMLLNPPTCKDLCAMAYIGSVRLRGLEDVFARRVSQLESNAHLIFHAIDYYASLTKVSDDAN